MTDLIAERDALAARLDHLRAVLADPNTPRDDDRRLLAEQEQAMDHYLEVLEERIDRLSEDEPLEEPIEGEPDAENRVPEGE